MGILSIGDIGAINGMLHVGDEAMFEAFLDAMRARSRADITAVSANPPDTRARYGIPAIAQHAVDPRTAAAAVRASDGLMITGGGNLSSLWPQHIHERLALARIAADHGIPIVVSGQTIGPHLTDEDAVLVRELLSLATVVGLRESRSFELCLRLGVDPRLLTATVDDASFLVDDAVVTDEPPYCLVTLARHTGGIDSGSFIAAVATLLDDVAEHTGLHIRFSAHFVSLAGDKRGDSLMHELVRNQMTTNSTVVEVRDARESARLARSASLVVSSRYHPAVFAVAAGVPTIGITVDDYTSTKLQGALENFGQSSVLAGHELVRTGGSTLLSRIWPVTVDSHATTQAFIATRRRETALWWDRVAEVFPAA